MKDLVREPDDTVSNLRRAADAPPALEEVRLLGLPPLGGFLAFVERRVVGGADIPERQLCDEWRAANEHYHELEEREAGLAETVGCTPLDPQLDPLVEQVRANPYFQETFDQLPNSFAMVELDKLVVYQPGVVRSWSDGVAARLGNTPDPVTVFRYCQPLDAPAPPCTIEEASDDRFVFSSPAPHITFHDARLLKPEEVPNVRSFGPVAGIVALVVGFRGNFLNAIRADGRILLNNGYHRAYALRSLGITHVPCVIEEVASVEELRLRVDDRVGDQPGFYFRKKRPPLFKDFFDPMIAKAYRVRPRRRVVEVSYDIDKSFLSE